MLCVIYVSLQNFDNMRCCDEVRSIDDEMDDGMILHSGSKFMRSCLSCFGESWCLAPVSINMHILQSCYWSRWQNNLNLYFWQQFAYAQIWLPTQNMEQTCSWSLTVYQTRLGKRFSENVRALSTHNCKERDLNYFGTVSCSFLMITPSGVKQNRVRAKPYTLNPTLNPNPIQQQPEYQTQHEICPLEVGALALAV